VNIARGISHLFNRTIFISIGVHFIAVGGFSFTISGYFDIIPLTDRQKQENKQRSSIRYIVERTFGLLKQHHRLAKARYLGLEKD
jgi:hypothetical protein